MSLEQGKFEPIVIAEKLNLRNLVHAILDSPVVGTHIHVGRLGKESKTVKTRNGDVPVDQVYANPSDLVITHEI